MTFTAFGPYDLVFQVTLESACFGLAPQPLTFAVSGPTHGRAAVVTTIRGKDARRIPEGLITAGTVAENLRKLSAA
jgi:hypothetical protein